VELFISKHPRISNWRVVIWYV